MDSLNDILSHKDLDEPGEITAIKRYVERQFDAKVSVAVSESSITLTASSAALISALRMQTTQIQQAAGTGKKIIFRITG